MWPLLSSYDSRVFLAYVTANLNSIKVGNEKNKIVLCAKAILVKDQWQPVGIPRIPEDTWELPRYDTDAVSTELIQKYNLSPKPPMDHVEAMALFTELREFYTLMEEWQSVNSKECNLLPPVIYPMDVFYCVGTTGKRSPECYGEETEAVIEKWCNVEERRIELTGIAKTSTVLTQRVEKLINRRVEKLAKGSLPIIESTLFCLRPCWDCNVFRRCEGCKEMRGMYR